jgi:hypothetical protein
MFANSIYIHLITPVYSKRVHMPDSILNDAKTKSQDYSCDYYCFFVRFITPDNRVLPSCMTIDGGALSDSPFNFWKENGKFHFGVNAESLYNMYLFQKGYIERKGINPTIL